ncbi:MAG: hypothetical protein IJV22_02005 [Bacteroidales bacterium]|nr:hypothetical protein [Bacteroidales bacterium]
MVQVSKSAKQTMTKQGARETNIYASVQVNDKVSTDDFCAHIAEHNSKYGPGDVHAILYEVCSCLHEMMLNGKEVNLGPLGSFRPTISSAAAKTYAEFTSKNIKMMSVIWKKGKLFKNLRSEAEFTFVPTRELQVLINQAVISGEMPEELVVRLSGSTSGNDTSNSGSGTGGSSTGGGDNSGSGTTGGGSTGGNSGDDEP